MFSKEITDLLKGDNFEVLNLLSQYNPERFKKDVNALSEKGNSFFIFFMSQNGNLEYVQKLLDLCISFGYDFCNKKKPYHEDDIYKMHSPKNTKDSFDYKYGRNYPLNNKNPQFTPEYITAFSYANNDNILAFLTEQMGKERMLQLENDGWPILEYAYRKHMYKTIEILCDYGFDYKNTPSGTSIISLAENEPKLLDLYWKIKNQKENNSSEFMSEQQFNDFFGLFESNIIEVLSKKAYRAEQIIKLVDEKKDILTKEQKEKLLIRSIPAPDDRIFKAIAKLLKYKQKGPELTNIVLDNLELISSHHLLYWVVEDSNLFFKNIEKSFVKKESDSTKIIIKNETDTYGIDKIINKLSSLRIRIGYKHESDRQKEMVNNTFLGRFKELFKDQNILFRKFDSGLNLFEKILFNEDSKENLLKFLDVKPKPSNESNYSLFKTLDENTFNQIKNGTACFSEEQKIEIREILDKTWNKKVNGESNLKRAMSINVFDNDFFLFESTIMKEEGLYTNTQKMEIFKFLVEHYSHWKFFTDPVEKWKNLDRNDYNSTKMLKSLYFTLADDPQTKWNNLNLSEDTIKSLKNSEFLYELKARQLGEELKENKVKSIKPKWKL